MGNPMDHQSDIQHKEQELHDCIERCNQLRTELSAMRDACSEGGQCEWTDQHWLGSHGYKDCSKCNRREYFYSLGGRRRRRSRKRKSRKTRRKRRKRRRTRRRRR